MGVADGTLTQTSEVSLAAKTSLSSRLLPECVREDTM